MLTSFQEKLRGLLGASPHADGVALCRCSSVHTWGMAYPIDVALVSRQGVVLLSQREVGPCRLLGARGAYYALERPSSVEPWPRVGSWLSIAITDGAATDGNMLARDEGKVSA